MQVSSPPMYGSTREKNKEDKIGGRTIIDIHSCLDVCFVALWVFSICARPTIVSSVHMVLFGVYVIIGGIIMYETHSKQHSKLSLPLSIRKHRRSQSAKKKKKRYKVELTDLSESFIVSKDEEDPSDPQHNNTYHPAVRYGIHSSVMLTIAVYCCIVAVIQVIIQILIAAQVIDGHADILKMFGFHEPDKYYEYILYLTVDLSLAIFSLILFYLHRNRNRKHRVSSLNIINVQNVLLLTSKSLSPLYDTDHHSLSDISSSDEDSFERKSISDLPNTIFTEKKMLITGRTQPTLSFFYQSIISCLLLVISIAAPSILHIPYFLVVLLVCSAPIIDVWQSTKPVFHTIGPIYLILHLILISLYQIEAVHESMDAALAEILGLHQLHQKYWRYADTIKNQHIVPNLVATLFSLILFYTLGLRPILLHSSLYTAAQRHLNQIIRKSRTSIAKHFFKSPTRHKAHSTTSLIYTKQKSSKTQNNPFQNFQRMEPDSPKQKHDLGVLEEKKDAPHDANKEAPHIINVSATSIISDRKTSIMNSLFCKMSPFTEDVEEKEERNVKESRAYQPLQKDHKHKKRANTLLIAPTSRKGTVQINDDNSGSSDDSDDDGIMDKVEKQETLRRARAEQMSRKKESIMSARSISTVRSSRSSQRTARRHKEKAEQSVVTKKAREYLQSIAHFIEGIGEWIKWRFFLWGPFICQLVCLWSCFPHHDAFFIVILIWSFMSLFLLSAIFEKRDIFKHGVAFILTYSICAAFVKYVSYIPALYNSSDSSAFTYFGMKDYGDLNGSYMFVACMPFIITSGYLKIQKLYRLISCERIVSYLKSSDRRKSAREMKKIASFYPQNFTAIMSKRGGTILHCCVDFRNAAMISIVAPFVNVNARDMYGRTALSQARKIHKHSSDRLEKEQMTEIITALWKVGCLRKKQMHWYSVLYQYISMAGNYAGAAFYYMIEKFILFGVYIISTERADIIHLIYLLYFLVFLGLGPLAHKYWWTLVIYNGFAVTLRYIFVVFDIHPSDVIADEFGLQPPNITTGLIYPSILLSVVILNDHLMRKRKERHTLLEFKFEELILRNTSRRTKSFLFAILYYMFYLIQDWCLLFVYIALIMIGLVQIHAIHLGYCVCVFFCFFFHCWFKDPWKKIRGYWILIVAYCAICFFGLYASQYSFIHKWLEEDVYPQGFGHRYFSLEDIGLSNEDKNNEEPFAMFKPLLGPVIAMILTVIQFSYFVSNKPHQEVKRNYYVLKLSRLCCQLLYLGCLHCEKLLLFTSFIWCVYRVNLISFTYVLIICVALINRITLRSAWCPFQLFAVVVFILKYSYQYHYFQGENVINTTNAKVVGFERFGASIGDKPADASSAEIWSGLGQEITIILLATVQCVLQWWIKLAPAHLSFDQQKPIIIWKHQRIYYEEYNLAHAKISREKSYTYIGDDSDDNKKEPLLQQQFELKIDDYEIQNYMFDADDDDHDRGLSTRENTYSEAVKGKKYGTMSHVQLSSALRYTRITWLVMYRCLWRTLRRFYHVITNMFYFYGVELSVIMMVFAAFYRNYSFSCIYIGIATLYIYDSRNNGSPTRRDWHLLRKIWWILCIALILWLLVQYWIVIPYEIEDVIGTCCASKWWKLFHFNYDFYSSEYKQWWSWIAFIDYEATDLLFDFMVLLFVSLQRTNFIQHDKDEKQAKTGPGLKHRLTLTKHMKKRSDADENADILWQNFKLQCFIYSDKVLLLLMFIFGIMNVDLLSIVFLLFPFFELFFTDSTNQQQLLYWWHYVQVYNIIVLTLFTYYQMPFILAPNVDKPFISWQSILGVYKTYSNGDGYCADEPCINIFSNSSIIHNIILLIIIDLQIKILTSQAYENSVIATYREWILFSKYRCFHSALMMKFRRLAQIDYYQDEKQIVQYQLEEIFSDKDFHKRLNFKDEELTYYPRLEGELADKEEQEKALYKRSIKGQYSKRDANWNVVNQYNKDDVDLMDETDEDDEDDEKKHKEEEMKEQEDEEDGDKLFVPYEQGLFILIDKDFYVINIMAPNERHCKVMQFFDGGDDIPWRRYLRHLFKKKKDDPFVAEFIVSREEVIEPDLDENGNEIQTLVIKQYTENVAIVLKEPSAALDFDTKAIIPPDAMACVVLLPECSKFESLRFKINANLSDLWIWIRMFMITFVDTSMYCNAMDLMRDIAKIRKQLDTIDNKQLNADTKSNSGDLMAYHQSQKRLLQNVPQPNQEELDFYAQLQKYYQERDARKRKEHLAKKKVRQEKKMKKQITTRTIEPKSIASSLSSSVSISPERKRPHAQSTSTKTHETYFDRRRHSELVQAQGLLRNKLSHLKQKTLDGIDLCDLNSTTKCDNLLEMAVEIQSTTLDYLNQLNWISLFTCVILSHSQELAVLCFFVTLFAHATILYSIVPISFLIYGLLLKPRADQEFWLWIAAYTQIVMVLKFLYQLDIFCVAQYLEEQTLEPYYYYNIQSSYNCANLNQGQVRWDQILGITKSEYDNDAVSILFGDIVCLIFVAIHIMMLKKKGVWYQTEHDYDDYIGLWFNEYETRQYMYTELEKTPAKNQKIPDYKGYNENKTHIKRIGEPQRVYDEGNDVFIENNIEFQRFAIDTYRAHYVGISTWDCWMYKFHVLLAKILPHSMRKSLFELIPPSFRLLNSSESICDEVKPGIDLYFWTFVVDLILLVWLLLFYQQMAETKAIDIGSGGFSTSRFSGDMVFVLFVQICFMIMDRIVYLTDTLILKLICQFISVIVFHWLIFVDWPQNTNTLFYENPALVMYYLFRVIYWLLSCSQIAYGYPTFTRSHSRMSKEFNFWYYCFFVVYMAIPFVYEMRTLLEWVCIPTTLQLIELLKVEEIYGQLFQTKCINILYKEQRNRGEPILMFRKFFAGGCVFIGIIFFLIVPLLLFSTASPASAANPVVSSRLSISIINIQGFGNLDLFSLSNYRIETIQTPIDLRPFFDATSQISQSIQFESDADSIFTVPTVLRNRVSEILSCDNITFSVSDDECQEQLRGTQIEMKYEFTRLGPDDNNPIEGLVYLNNEDLTPQQGKELSQVLNSSNTNISSFLCPLPYLQWLRLQAQHNVITYNLASNPNQTATLTLNSQEYESYWAISPAASFVLVSDSFVSSTWLAVAGVSSYSVIGFYAIVVYSFAQLLRLLYGDQVKQIIFKDLQCIDYILRIVTAVKLARTQRNYYLEELLYRKLIRIYRDPALLVLLTRRLDENQDKGDALEKHSNYNDPQSFGWGIRNRKDQILKKKKEMNEDHDEATIVSTIKQD